MAAPKPSRGTVGTLSTCLAQSANAVQDALDRLRSDEALKNLDLSFPRIIAIGSESCGKSTVLERLIGMRVFPKGENICTRMPIELRLFHKAAAEMPKGKVRCRLGFATDPFNSNVQEQLTDMMPYPELLLRIKKFHDDRVIEKNGSLTGIIDDILVVEIHSTLVHNLRLLDLPGIIQTVHEYEPLDLAERSQALVRRHLEMDDTLVLAVVSAQEGIRSSLTMRWIQERMLMEKTVCVLTKSDLLVDARREFEHRPFHMLESVIEAGQQVLSRVIALKNPDTKIPVRPGLDEATAEESRWFSENLPDLLALKKAGLQAVSEQLVGLFKTYTTNWVPKTIDLLRQRIAAVQQDQTELLGPDPAVGTSLFCELLSHLSSYWRINLLNYVTWAGRFPPPEELQFFPRSFVDLTQFDTWKLFKETLALQIDQFVSSWFKQISDLACQPFVVDTPMRFRQFPELKAKIAEIFTFPVEETARRCQEQLQFVFLRYDANVGKRFKVHARVTDLLQTAVFEACLAKLVSEDFSECVADQEFFQQKLLACSDLETYLTESEEIKAQRQSFRQQIQNLRAAVGVIQNSFSS